jgi:hypothetical protein
MRESPLLEAVVPMPKVTTVIGKQEARAAFETARWSILLA